MNLKTEVQKKKIVFDGAFGTYYRTLYETEELPEKANNFYPERVENIHREYIQAGAEVIRTNTFATNTISLSGKWKEVEKNLRQGFRLAKKAAENSKVLVAADIGQIPYKGSDRQNSLSKEYTEIVKVFLEEGAELFVFETMSDLEELEEAIAYIGEKAYIIVQFSINQFGYSNAGLSGKKLLEESEKNPWIDAIGLNCGIGPGHMAGMIKNLSFSTEKKLIVLPNAGYPQGVHSRLQFERDNIEYYADKICEIASMGVHMVGGCCGTTPAYIARIKEKLDTTPNERRNILQILPKEKIKKESSAFFVNKAGKKLIAVELAPPLGVDDEKLMDAAHMLKKSKVDVLTFPDSPSGRTRVDSILIAGKVSQETGIPVMPHICCRDKNAIAMRSQLMGAHINHIKNFLVITGDPIPSLVRSSIKSVFNFDSVGLMRLIKEMNEEQFISDPMAFGGCINQGRRNLEIEIQRVKKKMEAGASFFLTQPVSTMESANRVRKIKEETGARILCGIMPFVSLKNATFMKNEMTGIEVTEEVLQRYRPEMTKEEGEEAGILLAKEMMELMDDFADGYYFSFPFNRVYMLEKILNKS